MVDRREGWPALGRGPVRDFAISKGSRMPLREFNVTPASIHIARLSRETRRGAMALDGRGGRGEARANWTPRIFTGHKGWPSLRGGSCTAPVATKAPHHRPSLSPLTLSLSPPFPIFLPPCGHQPLVAVLQVVVVASIRPQ